MYSSKLYIVIAMIRLMRECMSYYNNDNSIMHSLSRSMYIQMFSGFYYLVEKLGAVFSSEYKVGVDTSYIQKLIEMIDNDLFTLSEVNILAKKRTIKRVCFLDLSLHYKLLYYILCVF